MTIGPGEEIVVSDLTQEHNTDGTHDQVTNLKYGLASERPGTPVVGDVYISTDATTFYACYSAGAWTAVGTGGDEKVRVTANDSTPDYLINKLAGTGVVFTETNDGGTETILVNIAGAITNGIYYSNYAEGGVPTAPVGTAEVEGARGRAIVGMPTSGTLSGTIGTSIALTNVENRDHTHTTPSHEHGGGAHTHSGISHSHGGFSHSHSPNNWQGHVTPVSANHDEGYDQNIQDGGYVSAGSATPSDAATTTTGSSTIDDIAGGTATSAGSSISESGISYIQLMTVMGT